MDDQNIEITEDNEGYHIKRLHSLLIKVNAKTTVQDVINSMKNKEEIKNLNVHYTFKNAIIYDSLDTILAIVFRDPIKVKYHNILYKQNYLTLTQENAYSTLELDEILKKFGVTKANCIYLIGGIKHQSDYFILKQLLSKVSTLLEIMNLDKIYKLKENYESLKNKTIFNKNSLSKYFDKYFIYPTEKNDFELFDSENRENLMTNLYELKENKNVIKFKIAGPSGGGKSITLLYFSRIFLNIIYLNFKVIYKLFNDFKIDECFDLILYEFGRLLFIEEKTEENKNKKEEYKQNFEFKFKNNQGNSPWQLLSDISDFLKDKNVILIFDQFKSKYIPSNILKNIKNNLSSSFKIVFSSSINDDDIGNSVINSLYKYKGSPMILDESNQEDYFYYINLFDSKKLEKIFSEKNNDEKKLEQYKSFNFDPKYVKTINEEKKTLEQIKDDIISNMESHYKELGQEKDFYISNIYMNIGRNLDFDFLLLKSLPLKYCNLICENETFKIEYKFPYLQQIIEDEMKKIDIKEYFRSKKYEKNDLYSALKGPYFEFASTSQMEKIKEKFFEAKQIYTIYVDSIIEMDECKSEDNINQPGNYKTIERKSRKDLYTENLNKITKELENYPNGEPEIKDINYYFYNNLIQRQKQLSTFLGKKTEREKEIQELQEKNMKNKVKKKKKSKKNEIVKNIEIKDINTSGEKSNSNINIDEKIEHNLYNEEFKNGIILIKQKNLNGKTLDLGLLIGEKTKKNFVGFQMKFYGEKSKLKDPITKPLIKEKLQNILIKCFENFDIKITKWDYIMCLYYNQEDEVNYGHYLIEKCNKYNIQYFFYNPSDTKFYDRDLKELPFYKLDFKTNIDFISNYNPYSYFVNTGSLEEYCVQNSDASYMAAKIDTIFETPLKTAKKEIKNSLNKQNVELICRYKIVKQYPTIPIPSNMYLLVFQGKKNLLLYYNKNNEYFCKEIGNSKEIFPSFLPAYLKIGTRIKKEDNVYFYVFKME